MGRKIKPFVDFEAKAILQHNGLYSYDSNSYAGTQKLVSIRCHIHGWFEQRGNTHLQGQGCPTCRDIWLKSHAKQNGEKNAKVSNQKARRTFVNKSNKVHAGKYTYQYTRYKNVSTPVVITCRYHGNFKQTPKNHLKGQGCKECAAIKRVSHAKVCDTSGWILYYHKPTILYYIKFTLDGTDYYKIGITTKTIEQRFAYETTPFKILWSKQYSDGEYAYDQEQRILRQYRECRYYGDYILKSGNSELFTKNIMKEFHGE